MSGEAISLDPSRRRIRECLVYRGVTYDSKPEVLFAQALERAGVPYAPLTRICINPGSQPRVDFVIFWRGRALIVEIHGKAYHPAHRMTDEWNRTRPLLRHGVLIDFIDARDVLEGAAGAVDRALELVVAAQLHTA